MLRPDVEKWSLDKWQEMFKRIYNEKNSRYSPQEICFRLLEEVGELVYPIKQIHLTEIAWQIPDIFAWLCAVVYKLDEKITISNILWNKFRRGCPGCKRFEDCSCGDIIDALKKQVEPPVEKQATIFEQHKPTTMDDWQLFLQKIYERRNATLDPISLLARLIEDIGDVAGLIRKKGDFVDINSKIASSFAWLFGICNRFSYSYEKYLSLSFRLSEITWNKYSDICAKCHNRTCECLAPINRVFISYPGELNAEVEFLKQEVEKSLNLKVVCFPHFKDIWVPKGIMNQAFYSINTCEAAVILIGNRFSAKVYAEFLEAHYRLEKNNIFIAVKRGNEKDTKTFKFIEEIKTQYIYDEFTDKKELSRKIINKLETAIKKFKEWERR